MRLPLLFNRLGTTTKSLCPPILATFLCCLTIVIRPVAALGGPYAFLVLTIDVLFFFPGLTVGGQIESSILGLVGGCAGLGWACVGIGIIASLNRQNGGAESNQSRIVASFFIAIQSCVCGYIRSHSPRLTSFARISLFHSVWLLTTELDRVNLPASVPLELLYPTLFACLASFIATIAFPRTSVSKCVGLVQQAFRTSEELLLASIDTFFLSYLPEQTPPAHLTKLSKLKSQLQTQSSSLPQAFAQASYEISYTRFSIHRLNPFTTSIRRLKQDLASGSSQVERHDRQLDGHSGNERAARNASQRAPFEEPTRQFAKNLIKVFAALHHVLDGRAGEDLKQAREELRLARGRFILAMDKELDKAVDAWEDASRIGRSRQGVSRKAHRLDRNLLRISLFMYKILAVSRTLDSALESAAALRAHTSVKATIRMPTLTRAWLGSSSLSAKWDETAQDQDQEDDEDGSQHVDRSRQDIQASIAEVFLTPPPARRARRFSRSPLKWFYGTFLVLWDSHCVLSFRLTLARFVQALHARKHNFTYSIKLGLGFTLLTLPAFLPPSSHGRIWFTDIRGQWIPISYLFVLDVTSGQTWRVGTFRVMGTVSGAILAGIIWLIAHDNPYALISLTSCYGALAGYVIMYTTFPGVGVVLSITVPPVLFIPYLRLSTEDVVELAWKRTVTVCIGIVAAVLVTEFIFPARSKRLFLGTMAQVLDDLTKMYLAMSRSLIQQGPYSFDTLAFERLQQRVETNLMKSSSYLNTLKLEITLIHKPLRAYRQTIVAARSLSDLFIALSIIRQEIPREQTVHVVLEQRKELVRTQVILVSQTILDHSSDIVFLPMLPLPQFLPSPGRAVRTWEDEVIKGLISPHPGRRSTSTSSESSTSAGQSYLGDSTGDLSVGRSFEERARLHKDMVFLYAFAEAEALEETTKVMEDLTELTRALFGSSTFFNRTTRSTHHHDDDDEV
ncbi:Predicted membrane protein [Phaffia rhodozyma]|uniref:Predicted membrane protein n=1 Tax=Phaffia rhodozyma TaxID=264483 RepID=A0A0F7SJA0_PHARH|nr:Predicted membrane protein [Phaffia rhodozyma]